jgi:CheY-like chemotaxis protein
MPTVMVVDDTAIIRETVARLLRREGYQTLCAANGKEALAMLKFAVPDLLLMDIMMPEMDGMECLASLRQEPKFRLLPVIVMSALSDEEHQHQAQELGACDYLVKAKSSISQILERVRHCIDAEPPRN